MKMKLITNSAGYMDFLVLFLTIQFPLQNLHSLNSSFWIRLSRQSVATNRFSSIKWFKHSAHFILPFEEYWYVWVAFFRQLNNRNQANQVYHLYHAVSKILLGLFPYKKAGRKRCGAYCPWGNFWNGPKKSGRNFHLCDIVQILTSLPQPSVRGAGNVVTLQPRMNNMELGWWKCEGT